MNFFANVTEIPVTRSLKMNCVCGYELHHDPGEKFVCLNCGIHYIHDNTTKNYTVDPEIHVIGVVTPDAYKNSKSYKTQSECQSNCHISRTSECSICLDSVLNLNPRNKILSLSCNHAFHYKCIIRWIKKKPTCPICRQNIRTPLSQDSTTHTISNLLSTLDPEFLYLN